jgi:hypothetical protein
VLDAEERYLRLNYPPETYGRQQLPVPAAAPR